MRVTEDMVRGLGIGIVYLVGVLLLLVNTPETAEGGLLYNMFAILWALVTISGVIWCMGFAWWYLWASAERIADWVNTKLETRHE